ncbi:MAG: DNA recombination protein RmuC [Halieaceae bacterium]|jgi:DNA recombination protein RmuC|nr:DNA recombination protein RmuC [Halieaceae bacterium]
MLIYMLAAGAGFFLILSVILVVLGSMRANRAAHQVAQYRLRQEQAEEGLARLQRELETAHSDLEQSRSAYRELSEAQVRLEERSLVTVRAAEEKIELLQSAREQMKTEFNNLANRIFEEKSERLLKNNKSSLDATLGPLKTQLEGFRKKVEDVYDSETRDRVSLRAELEQLKKLNVQMSEDAINLTRALKGDKKTQGNWGEVVLERVLEQSGLRKGTEYETQVNLVAQDGTRRLPDVIIRLPDNKEVVIDAKVSLVDYEQYINASSDQEKSQSLQRHVTAVSNHISGLSLKEYEKLEAIQSLDFVLLFIPIESAFVAAFDADPGMFKRAYDKQVIVVSPTTLLATLRTIQTIWRYEHQNQNADKIAAQAGGIYDQFSLVIESLDEVGRNLEKASESFDKTHRRLRTGKGNLLRRVQLLKDLGARTKKTLPASVTKDSLGEPEDSPDDTDIATDDD